MVGHQKCVCEELRSSDGRREEKLPRRWALQSEGGTGRRKTIARVNVEESEVFRG